MRQVEFEVEQLQDPWRTAIYALARSASTGTAVLRSGRVHEGDWHRVLKEARQKIRSRLVCAGVLER